MNRFAFLNTRNLSIRTKLILLLGFIALLSLFMVSTMLIINEKYSAKNNLIRELESTANLVALNTSAAMMFNDKQAALENLTSLSTKPEIIVAVLYDETGNIYAQYSGENVDAGPVIDSLKQVYPDSGQMLAQLEQSGGLNYSKQDRIHVIRPVIVQESFLGAIHLVDNMQLVKKRVYAYYVVVASSVFITLIVVLLLSSKIQSFFTGPVFEVIDSMRNVSKYKDFRIQVKKKGDDEFGVLVDHFNEMIREIHKRDKELKEYSAGLETMVEKRTEDLSLAKSELESMVVSLKKAKDEAEEASRIKSQFLANMSHEIRTPMNGVLGMTELLISTTLSQDQYRYVETIQHSGESLLEIINDILDFSKIEAGKLELETIDFDLQLLIEDVSQLLASHAHAKQLEVAICIDDGCDRFLKGDPTRLRQVMINILGNAIKFTEKGEVIVKTATTPIDRYRVNLNISISDTGVGISPQDRQKLFKPFSQADGSTTRKYGGTGLGLTISHELVSLMGGTLDCESEPGHGATFYFTIPMLKNNEMPKRAVSLSRHELKGLKALIVDDHPINREILERQIASYGMIHDSAGRGAEGLKKLKRAVSENNGFDIVVLDMDMPEMDGFEVTRRIKTDPDLKQIPIIMLTSVLMRGDAQTAMKPGANSYLTKPVRKSDLHAAILKVLGHSMADLFHEPVTQPSPGEETRTFDLNVLLAEDNTTNQEVAAGMLKQFGCRVSLAVNGVQAVELFLKERPDLVFMDCQMPEMDGYQATGQIRNHEEQLSIRTPIVALTAHALKGDKEKCLAAGMDDFLGKPFKSDQLKEILDRWSVPYRKGDKKVTADMPGVSSDGYKKEVAADTDDKATVIDPAAIQSIRDLQMEGEPSILKNVITAYITDVETKIRQIKKMPSPSPTKEIKIFAHTLKSSSANIGAVHLSQLGKKLEIACKNNAFDDLDRAIESIETEFARVKTALEKERC